MKPSFSEPKIYTGGIDPKDWSKHPKKEQREALQKDWYVRWSFRDPKTGKLKRQPNIKAGVNRLKTKRERLAHLKTLQRNLHWLLERGFSPYADNGDLIAKYFPEKNRSEVSPGTHDRPPEVGVPIPEQKVGPEPYPSDTPPKVLAKDLIQECLRFKEKTLSPTSFSRFKSKIGQFSKWLLEEHGDDIGVSDLDRKLVMAFLNAELMRTSARTRNNAKADLSALFQYLEDNGHIIKNFVRGIKNLTTKPNLHRTYTQDQLDEIDKYLMENDPVLLLFSRFISYALLRPIEICRLRVRDIDFKAGTISVQTKTKKRAIRLLPEILIGHLPPLEDFDPESYLFTPHGFGGVWDTEEQNKRDYFSKRFKKAKDTLGYGKEYGLYSFRHTHITMMYRKLRQDLSPFIAKSRLMAITGHATMDALEKYLRDINAELPDDYSGLFSK